MTIASLGQRSTRADLLGMGVSTLCVIHCAALPLLVAVLPVVGAHWLAGESVGRAAIICAASIAGYAFWRGYRLHASLRPAVLGVAGLVGLGLAETALEGRPGIAVLASLFGGSAVATAHLVNRRMCRSCVVCGEHSTE